MLLTVFLIVAGLFGASVIALMVTEATQTRCDLSKVDPLFSRDGKLEVKARVAAEPQQVTKINRNFTRGTKCVNIV